MRADSDIWLRQYFVDRLGALDRERAGWLGTWRELAGQFAPRRGRFPGTPGDSHRGSRGDENILDNTPLLAARIMASGMMAGISSPARPWFRLRVADMGLADPGTASDPAARAWLDEVQKRLLHVFARSNLYNCLHTLYGELGIFGTAALWVDEDEEDVVRGYVLTAGEYWLASSRRLAVDTLYRTLTWTARQIVDSFGRAAVSPAIASAYDQGRFDAEFEIVHALEPNPLATVGGLAPGGAEGTGSWHGNVPAHFPYRSVWFERTAQGERALLRISGYEEFPCMAPRWEVTGADTWGSGPGWIALGDALQLQAQQRLKARVLELQANPPMVAPPSLKNEPASLLPGGVTYVADPAGQYFRPAVDIRVDLGALSADIAQVQARVRSAFYADLFLMMAESDRREVTAREIDERHEEKMLMLGPVLERLHDELLDPLVARVFNIMARQGLLPEPPPSLLAMQTRGRRLQLEFISLLAQAQKSVATGAIERFWRFGTTIGALKPEALDRLDADGTIDAYAEMTGVPASVVVDRQRAEALRTMRLAALPAAPLPLPRPGKG